MLKLMIRYAARTGTGRNLRRLRQFGWRLMISARGVLRTEGFLYALDNGAWTAFQERLKGKRATAAPCLRSFTIAVEKLGADADFIVVPDIVEGGAASWALTRYWLRRLRRDRRLRRPLLLIAVQDGYDPWTIARYLGPRVGIFVGGSTDWKLATFPSWQRLARACGAYCHVARVNSGKRAKACDIAGVDSIDGSGPSRFEKCLLQVEQGIECPDIEGAILRMAA